MDGARTLGVDTRDARWMLAAGLVPLPWFLFWVTLAGLLLPEYRAVAQHASEMTLQPGLPHALIKVSAIGSGLAFCVFARALWRATRPTFSFGALSWFLFGVAMISNGIWPMGSPLHGLYALGVINLVAPALSLAELRGLRDDRTAYGVTVLASLCGVLYLWMNLTGHDPEGARGLTQRIFSSINSLWPAVIAWLLLRRGARV